MRLAVEDHNAVWFKANPPGSAFEATLTSALAHWVPEHVLEPLAVDADHGWSLLPHGGELFRDVLNRSPADPRVWEELLGQEPAACMAVVPNGHLRKGVQDPEAEAVFAPEHVVSGGLEALCRYLAGNGVGLPGPTKMVIPPPRQ
ncbi:hypothetical protein ACH4WW_09225 [Streptomyces halstedii]|uniref:hypothetical protein n=1 Tax=Streptomyces halstedii TaxID=1944 RepID=UPI00378CAD6F